MTGHRHEVDVQGTDKRGASAETADVGQGLEIALAGGRCARQARHDHHHNALSTHAPAQVS